IVSGVGAVRTRGDNHGGRGVRKEESTSFLKKRSKKLFGAGAWAVWLARAPIDQVVCAFLVFTKKKIVRCVWFAGVRAVGCGLFPAK
ncbi:hypothetical protein, partial [Acidiphilium sp.]|uniref:hypothetical protein n=1 Tax=Acidiphilium sp. TaxID=527 RepID=UPI002587D673